MARGKREDVFSAAPSSYIDVMREPPPILYKYYHPLRYPVIDDRALWFAHPSTFNDPFDVLPHFVLVDDPPPKKPDQPAEEFILEALLKAKRRQDVLDDLRNFGLCCFSETATNPLMWAHYADYHRGFVVGYASGDLPANDRLLEPVRYSTHRPSARSARELRAEDVLLTKSLDWHYEREWRLIQESTGRTALAPSAIREVILGYRAVTTTMEAIRQALRDPQYAHVDLTQVALDKEEFELRRKPTPPFSTTPSLREMPPASPDRSGRSPTEA